MLSTLTDILGLNLIFILLLNFYHSRYVNPLSPAREEVVRNKGWWVTALVVAMVPSLVAALAFDFDLPLCIWFAVATGEQMYEYYKRFQLHRDDLVQKLHETDPEEPEEGLPVEVTYNRRDRNA